MQMLNDKTKQMLLLLLLLRLQQRLMTETYLRCTEKMSSINWNHLSVLPLSILMEQKGGETH